MAGTEDSELETDVPDWMLSNELYNEFKLAFVSNGNSLYIYFQLQSFIIFQQKPTPDDIAKKLSQDELKLLCRRVRCRVDMWKYNPVEDFAHVFRKEGRFLGKPQKFINKLLLKAYRTKPHYFKAVEEEKEKEADREWQQRKKDSLLRLNQWHYEAEQRIRDSEVETVLAPEYEPIEIETVQSEEYLSEYLDAADLQDGISHVNPTVEKKKPSDEVEGEFDVCINSESITLNTQSMPESDVVSEPLNASINDLSLHTSQVLDTPVMPFESEAQSQEVDYNGFQEFIPLASTQDGIC